MNGQDREACVHTSVYAFKTCTPKLGTPSGRVSNEHVEITEYFPPPVPTLALVRSPFLLGGYVSLTGSFKGHSQATQSLFKVFSLLARTSPCAVDLSS